MPGRKAEGGSTEPPSDAAGSLLAVNTIEQPGRVTPQRLDPPAPANRMAFKVPARSYTVAQLAVTVQ